MTTKSRYEVQGHVSTAHSTLYTDGLKGEAWLTVWRSLSTIGWPCCFGHVAAHLISSLWESEAAHSPYGGQGEGEVAKGMPPVTRKPATKFSL